MTKLEKRFWSKVDIKSEDDCWEWQACRSSKGYGCFVIDNTNKGAHRVSWELHHKCKIPDNVQILHKCDNPKCVNPKHLFIGTHYDNMLDAKTKKKFSFYGVKFYKKEILKIRELLISGHSQKIIAELFNTNQNAISRINSSDKYPCKEGFYI